MSENSKNYHKLRGRAYLYSFLGFCVIVMFTAVLEMPSPLRELIILLVTGGIYNYLNQTIKINQREISGRNKQIITN